MGRITIMKIGRVIQRLLELIPAWSIRLCVSQCLTAYWIPWFLLSNWGIQNPPASPVCGLFSLFLGIPRFEMIHDSMFLGIVYSQAHGLFHEDLTLHPPLWIQSWQEFSQQQAEHLALQHDLTQAAL